MSLKEWERDVLNRQRNIVFPDTNLNEGRFYRNIASGKAIFSRGQRISLLAVVGIFLVATSVSLASVISQSVADDGIRFRTVDILACIYSLGTLLFWVFVAVKGLLPSPAPARKRRGGYRRSGRV